VPKIDKAAAGAFSEKTIETFKRLFSETVMNDKLTQYIADIAATW